MSIQLDEDENYCEDNWMLVVSESATADSEPMEELSYQGT